MARSGRGSLTASGTTNRSDHGRAHEGASCRTASATTRYMRAREAKHWPPWNPCVAFCWKRDSERWLTLKRVTSGTRTTKPYTIESANAVARSFDRLSTLLSKARYIPIPSSGLSTIAAIRLAFFDAVCLATTLGQMSWRAARARSTHRRHTPHPAPAKAVVFAPSGTK